MIEDLKRLAFVYESKILHARLLQINPTHDEGVLDGINKCIELIEKKAAESTTTSN